MKPIMQTKFGKEEGNCFQASVASLFELKLDEVPDFCNIYRDDEEHWFREFVLWLGQWRMSAIMIDTDKTDLKTRPNYQDCFLLVGAARVDGVEHSIIYYNGDLVHDPNPNSGKLKIRDVILIFHKNPKELRYQEKI
jgi:hypothetical protein